jgi:hypothetical protein
MIENKSEIACLLQRIELEEEAARRGLYGFAVVASHELITARMELGAERILRLITEGKHDEAVALMNTESWGVEVEEGQEGAGDGQAHPGHWILARYWNTPPGSEGYAMRPAKGESKAIPQVRIGLNDARALLAMLKGYLAYVYGAVPSSHERDAQIRMIQGVRGRLEALLAAPGRAETPPIWLTRQEIRALDEALSGFVQVVRVVVPASSLRDETLREIEGFRDMLRMRLSSTRS